ncbi:MAG: DUF1778 domain-containing protein [FCB group bacterium]|nr:DUF1778 domain-containing protein [FCB group bacterium]
MSTAKTTRFDARLSLEQKEFFERAASLGGYRNLTDFIIKVSKREATKIIEKNEEIIASNRDKRIFFNAMINAAGPNENLISAKNDYEALINE